jgi:hypothetical protein
MPTFLTVFADPVKVTMLLICIFGTAFMTWFLVGLFTDRTRMRARYVVRFKLGKDRSDMAFEDRLCEEPLFDEARPDQRQTDRTNRFPVQVRIEQRF